MLAVLVAGCFGCAKPGHRRSWLSWLLDALAVRDSDALVLIPRLLHVLLLHVG